MQGKAGWSVERVRLDHAMASVQLRGLGPLREAYVPRGPVPSSAEAVKNLVAWARERKIAKLRVEPDAPLDFGEDMKAIGFTAIAPTQPAHTRIVKLMSPDRLLASFHHGRRYNIRAGLRRGVIVEEGEDGAVARIGASRDQVAALALHGAAVVQAGRPPCPLCGEPLDKEGHVCVRMNGHKRLSP